jgi:hypothetical protein
MALTKVLHLAGTNYGIAAGSTRFIAGTSGTPAVTTTEADSETKVWRTTNYSNFFVNVRLNAVGNSMVLHVRKNGSSTAMTISVGSGATGYFEDASNTASFVNNDKVCYQIVHTGASTSTIGNIGMYAQRSGRLVNQISSNDNGSAFSAAGTVNFALGQRITTTTNALGYLVRSKFRIMNREVLITANTRSSSTTIAGLSIGAGATGLFDSTAVSGLFTSGSASLSVVLSAGTGSITVRRVTVEQEFVGNVVQYAITNNDSGTSLGTTLNGTINYPIMGSTNGNLTPNPSAVKFLENVRVTRMTWNTATHGLLTGSGITFNVLKNGATTGLDAFDPVGSGGNFTVEDTSPAVDYNTTDTVGFNYVRAGGNNSSAVRFWGISVIYLDHPPDTSSVKGGAVL